MEDRKLKIAILGSQGIPAKFGGFETFAEQLATRLVQRNFAVTVFCEAEGYNSLGTYKGVTLSYVKTPKITKIANQLYSVFKGNYIFYLENGYTDFKS